MPTAEEFVACWLPWCLMAVGAIGWKFGTIAERARWMGVVTDASKTYDPWPTVRDYAIRVSAAEEKGSR